MITLTISCVKVLYDWSAVHFYRIRDCCCVPLGILTPKERAYTIEAHFLSPPYLRFYFMYYVTLPRVLCECHDFIYAWAALVISIARKKSLKNLIDFQSAFLLCATGQFSQTCPRCRRTIYSLPAGQRNIWVNERDVQNGAFVKSRDHEQGGLHAVISKERMPYVYIWIHFRFF